jgi:hypothetical protein
MSTALAHLSGYSKGDGDTDADDRAPYARSPQTDDIAFLQTWGSPMRSPERLAVATLVRRYFAAAASENGRLACSLVAPSVALGAAQGQLESSESRGCAATLTRLFAEQHRQLTEQQPSTMAVVEVRVDGEHALAVLAFKRSPVAYVLLDRESGAWRLDSLLANDMT